MRLLNRSISTLKKSKPFYNDYEISSHLYSLSVGKNHFGKAAVENFLSNSYILQPLMDPEIKKIKFDINKNTSQDFVAYIYLRFAKDLIHFPFQGNRTLSLESIKKATKLNSKLKPYRIKRNYNQNFYIDKTRKSPFLPSKDNKNAYEYLKEIFLSPKYVKSLNKIYDQKIYDWANNYTNKTNYHPLKQHYALLAIAKILDDLSLNQELISKGKKNLSFKYKNSRLLDNVN